jgi:hypothetical protein
MLLANPTEIREALGFDDMTDITDAITSALKAATTILSARLGTPFDAGEFTDRFYARDVGFRDGASVSTEFRLSRGFVREIVRCGYSDSMTALGLTPLDLSKNLMMDSQDRMIGRLRDYTTPYRGSFISITYTAGFPANPDDPDQYDLSVVPGWLQEAAKMRALIGLSGHPSLKQADVAIDTKTIDAELGAILSSNQRYTPVALLPM